MHFPWVHWNTFKVAFWHSGLRILQLLQAECILQAGSCLYLFAHLKCFLPFLFIYGICVSLHPSPDQELGVVSFLLLKHSSFPVIEPLWRYKIHMILQFNGGGMGKEKKLTIQKSSVWSMCFVSGFFSQQKQSTSNFYQCVSTVVFPLKQRS